MGTILSQPDVTKNTNEGKGLGLRYGLSSMQGWRQQMEDAHAVRLGIDKLDEWSYFAVFDGHAGKATAAYASSHLLNYIIDEIEDQLFPGENPSTVLRKNKVGATSGQENSETETANGRENPSQPTDKDEDNNSSHAPNQTNPPDHDKDPEEPRETTNMLSSCSTEETIGLVQSCIDSAFLSMDNALRYLDQDSSGCTAVCVFISPTHFFIANCGDSRAVLSRGHHVSFATEDHKPLNPKERKRIIEAGGVASDRINGSLAVSRALGDFEFKKDRLRGPYEQLVSPQPEVTVIERHQQFDEFLILACDGIWDVMENDQICDYVRYMLKVEPSLETICSSILEICLRKGSRDNMSVIIIVFNSEPELDPLMVEDEKKKDEEIANLIRQLATEDSIRPRTARAYIEHIIEDDSKDYRHLMTPGVGLIAKYELIRKIIIIDEVDKKEPNSESVSDSPSDEL